MQSVCRFIEATAVVSQAKYCAVLLSLFTFSQILKRQVTHTTISPKNYAIGLIFLSVILSTFYCGIILASDALGIGVKYTLIDHLQLDLRPGFQRHISGIQSVDQAMLLPLLTLPFTFRNVYFLLRKVPNLIHQTVSYYPFNILI